MNRLIAHKQSWLWFAILCIAIVAITVLIDNLFLSTQNNPYFDNSSPLIERPLSARSRDYLHLNLELISTKDLPPAVIEQAQQYLDMSYALLNVQAYINRYPCTTDSLQTINTLSEQLANLPLDLYQYTHDIIPVIQCSELIQIDQDHKRANAAIRMLKNIRLQRQLLFSGGLLILIIAALFKLLHSKQTKLITSNKDETHKWIKHAMIDALMDVPNRRAFNNELPQYIKKYVERGQPFSLLMCDIDYFKQYNDSLGHVAGDKALKTIALALAATLRANDNLYRYGGEEMVIILDNTDQIQAQNIGLRILEQINSQQLPHPTSEFGCITISIGCTTINKEMLDSEALIEEADACLYIAKQNGRNCLISSHD